jgi:hypothetical protein
MPGDEEVSESIIPRTSWRGSAAADGAHEAKAPRGNPRADDVPTAHRVSHPFDASDDSASRAMRLFPTPAEPQTTIPDESGSDNAAWIIRISSERPVSGHAKRT